MLRPDAGCEVFGRTPIPSDCAVNPGEFTSEASIMADRILRVRNDRESHAKARAVVAEMKSAPTLLSRIRKALSR